MKIVYFEMRKSWLKVSTTIFLLVFLGLNYFRLNDFCRSYYKTYGNFQEPYFRLYETVCGEITNEKLEPFKIRVSELEAEIMTQTYSKDYDPERYIYTGYAHGDFSLYSLMISPEISYAATYSNTSNKIAAKAAESYSFYKEIGNNYESRKNAMIYNLYSNRGISEYRATNWANAYFFYDFSSLLCVILLILGLSSSFTRERESGMYQLLSAYGKTKSTVISKVISSVVFCLILTVIFTVSDLIGVNHFLVIKNINMPLYSAEIFEFTPFNITFTEALLVCAGMRFLGLFVIALLIMAISKITPNTIAATVFSFAAVAVLILLSLISNSLFNPMGLLTPKNYLENFGVVNLFGRPILEIYGAIICAVLLCFAFIAAIVLRRKTNAASRT